jgi:hypothetical protein
MCRHASDQLGQQRSYGDVRHRIDLVGLTQHVGKLAKFSAGDIYDARLELRLQTDHSLA